MHGWSLKIILPLIVITTIMLNPILLSYGANYYQDKVHKLVGDGYIEGVAKITCWDYGDGHRIHIKILVTKVYSLKGSNLISAYIVDITKNGADSYIEIGHPVFTYKKHHYAVFSGYFDRNDFASTAGNDPCPIGDVGRIVVVVGTSPPSDEDTVSEGHIDIIAASTAGTTETDIL
jgi:hypothetical protein